MSSHTRYSAPGQNRIAPRSQNLPPPARRGHPGAKTHGHRRRIPTVGTGSSRITPKGGTGTGHAPGGGLEALLGQAARGDQDAFETICRQIAAPVFGTVRAVVRDPFQSEEVAQEVLIDVWRAASRFDIGRAAQWPG